MGCSTAASSQARHPERLDFLTFLGRDPNQSELNDCGAVASVADKKVKLALGIADLKRSASRNHLTDGSATIELILELATSWKPSLGNRIRGRLQ